MLATTAGEKTEIPKNGDAYDVEELVKKLKERRELEPNRKDITVAPEDGVHVRGRRQGDGHGGGRGIRGDVVV